MTREGSRSVDSEYSTIRDTRYQVGHEPTTTRKGGAMTDDLRNKTTFIESVIDQMVMECREVMYAHERATGRGAELNEGICKTIEEFENADDGASRLLGLLLNIGHSTVVASMGRDVEDATKGEKQE